MPGSARDACLVFMVIAVALQLTVGPTYAAGAPAGVTTSTAAYYPAEPPSGCPFPISKDYRGIRFTGRHAEYAAADTWYPSSDTDGNLYSPFTDGAVNGVASNSTGPGATTGYATIAGDDPLSLTIVAAGTVKGSPVPYAGRYPCGSLVHNGVWYYGTYCLHPSPSVDHDGIKYNWPWLGPFVGFRWSLDHGRSWSESPCTPDHPLFGETALKGEPVKLGAPHFVDFGRNMQYSPDGKAYLVAHGASFSDPSPRFGNSSWITGDQIYLMRVTPSVENINRSTAYEFYAGQDEKGAARWSRQLSEIVPILEWNNHLGCVTITYNAALRRYFLCVTDGGNTVSKYDTYLLASEALTGPWSLVAALREFGEHAYFVNIPSKFISRDGLTFWLCYSANFTNGYLGTNYASRPPGSRYGLCLQEVVLQHR